MPEDDSLLYVSGLLVGTVKYGRTKADSNARLEEFYEESKGPQPLRDYQKEAVARTKDGSNIICVAPTGSGKTKIFVEAAR